MTGYGAGIQKDWGYRYETFNYHSIHNCDDRNTLITPRRRMWRRLRAIRGTADLRHDLVGLATCSTTFRSYISP